LQAYLASSTVYKEHLQVAKGFGADIQDWDKEVDMAAVEAAVGFDQSAARDRTDDEKWL
jgi:hypothetical protein